MEVVYGQGEYIQGDKHLKGKIIAGEYKLYLKGPEGDLAATYIPLDKVSRVKKTWRGIQITIRLSAATGYEATIKAERKIIKEIIKDLVEKLNLKKQFLQKVWIGEVSWR